MTTLATAALLIAAPTWVLCVVAALRGVAMHGRKN